MMKNYLKEGILLMIYICMPVILEAQLTSSPYSLFGAGQIENYGFGSNTGMGGTGYAFSSGASLNNLNPASYNGVDSLVFLFEFGVFGKLTSYHTKAQDDLKFDANIHYLAVGFRLFPAWAISAGLTPFSSVGYRINSNDVIEGALTNYNKLYKGEGGINNFYLGNSVKINKNLSLGVNFSYIFGSIVQSETGEARDEFAGYYLENNISVHSWYMDYGLLYSFVNKGWKYSLGVVYGNKKRLNTSGETLFDYLGDTSTVELESEEINFQLPQKFGAGAGIAFNRKFKAGFDYEWKGWSIMDFSNPVLKTRNSSRFSAGLEFNPKRSLRDRGFMNMNYRLGAFYRKSYLVIDQTPINSKGISFGLGMPLRNDLSNVNLSFEYGINGTTTNGLIKENYWLLHVNFSLRSIWFRKAKYD